MPPSNLLAKESELDLQWLPNGFKLESNCNIEKSTLTNRKTADQMKKEVIDAMKKEQTSYKKKMIDLQNHYSNNIALCKMGDQTFGPHDKDCIDDPENLDDHPSFLDHLENVQCPIFGCKSRVKDVRKHLKSMHRTLSKIEMDNAVKFINILQRNKDSKTQLEGETNASNKKTDDFIIKTTNMVSRKGNYKECALCKVLVKNITSHLKKVHNYSHSIR